MIGATKIGATKMVSIVLRMALVVLVAWTQKIEGSVADHHRNAPSCVCPSGTFVLEAVSGVIYRCGNGQEASGVAPVFSFRVRGFYSLLSSSRPSAP